MFRFPINGTTGSGCLAAASAESGAGPGVVVRGGRVAGRPMWAFLRGLRSSQLFLLAAALFLVDLVISDPVPFLDEVILGVVTLFLARWKQRPGITPSSD